MKKLLRMHAHRFGSDDNGLVAVVFAVVLVPIVMATALAVDYAHVVTRQSELQAAVDEAITASLAKSPSGPTDAQTYQFLSAAMASLGDVTLTPGTDTVKNSVTTVTAASGATCSFSTAVTAQSSTCANSTFSYTAGTSTKPATYKATVTGTIATTILSNVFTGVSFAVKSTASVNEMSTPSSAQILATTARGIYWKQLQFFVHNVGATSDAVAATYVYQPTNLSGSGAPGTITITYSDGTTAKTDSNGNYISGTIKSVSLGSAYDKAYLVQTVSPSGCPAGQTPDPTKSLSQFTCIAAGSTVTSSSNSLQNSAWYNLMETFSSPTCVKSSWSGCSSYAYVVNPIGAPWSSSTNDPTTSNSLFVSQSAIPQPPTSAVQIAQGTVPSITKLIPCGQTTYWALEDTPWKSGGLSDGAWQSQDFFFTIQGVQCSLNSGFALAPVITQ